MASLDLSAAFDLVNIRLLLKRLKIVGLPDDVIDLVRVWLTDRFFYVSVNGNNSILFDLICGTVQGSILGPILYAIFVAPLFDLSDLTNFADDNFIIRWNRFLPALIIDMEKSLEMITKWLRDSGLKVNESKTELCLFHRLDQPAIKIKLFGSDIQSNKTMNVLGVLYDSKLQWSAQVSNVITKANKALHAIRIIRPYFNQIELRTLLTSNFYSLLYYNSEIWQIPSLNPISKQQLLSASAKALKLCSYNNDQMISFMDIHVQMKRATPCQMLKYKHALLLHKLYNFMEPIAEWILMNFNQIITGRQENFIIQKHNNYKIGSNILCNRLSTLNNEIPFSWLNMPISTYKVNCKKKYLL